MNNNRVLVLGANGMLGKMLSLYLDSNKELEITVTSRKSTRFIEKNFNDKHLKYDALLNNIEDLIIKKDKFGCIVNCIGIIKPKIDENDHDSVKNTIEVNSYLPIDLICSICSSLLSFIKALLAFALTTSFWASYKLQSN